MFLVAITLNMKVMEIKTKHYQLINISIELSKFLDRIKSNLNNM